MVSFKCGSAAVISSCRKERQTPPSQFQFLTTRNSVPARCAPLFANHDSLAPCSKRVDRPLLPESGAVWIDRHSFLIPIGLGRSVATAQLMLQPVSLIDPSLHHHSLLLNREVVYLSGRKGNSLVQKGSETRKAPLTRRFSSPDGSDGIRTRDLLLDRQVC